MKKLLIALCFTITYLALAQYPQPYAPYYSQCGQDKYLNEQLFHDKKNGIFIEIGAHDGISYSNAYYFEKYLGWTGLCIEPHPEKFAQLIKNRKALCIQACIASHNGTAQFLKISGEPNMLSGLYDSYDPRHLARVEKELARDGGTKEIITVQTINLTDLLAQHSINYVDFISIDTEGNELDILQSIDFMAIDIEVIIVENNFNSQDIRDFLASKRYQLLAKFQGDEIYRKIRS
ncbi:MAG TPA: FkbM family methyltransferase [Candidatus Babeliales bacterium]|nr:FkbM family methyltransferase [Candidatus Babeliales bacterium]